MNTRTLVFCLLCWGFFAWTGCKRAKPPEPTDPLVARGREIFFTETFNGNGRTCGTCHPAENNFTLDPAFIASLPDSDALFVAEFIPELSAGFENPKLLREFGLILENLNGFENPDSVFNLRGVPHVLAQGLSVSSQLGPRTGWSGDGSPGDGSLRSFATGAVIQHFTRSLNRIPGVDFRLPTKEELDALEAFMLSLGRQEELELPRLLKDPRALQGQAIFNDLSRGKCFACHSNAGANADTSLFGAGAGNLNFNTGVEDLPDHPARLTGEFFPPDDGLGVPGDGTFNTPSLVEAAETGPFFHNNAVSTLEGAVAFYAGNAFNNSPAGQTLLQVTGAGIELDATEIEHISAFLRVINALENIRQSIGFLRGFLEGEFLGNERFQDLPRRAADETADAIEVLRGGLLHPKAVTRLQQAKLQIQKEPKPSRSSPHLQKALEQLEKARDELVVRP